MFLILSTSCYNLCEYTIFSRYKKFKSIEKLKNCQWFKNSIRCSSILSNNIKLREYTIFSLLKENLNPLEK